MEFKITKTSMKVSLKIITNGKKKKSGWREMIAVTKEAKV